MNNTMRSVSNKKHVIQNTSFEKKPSRHATAGAEQQQLKQSMDDYFSSGIGNSITGGWEELSFPETVFGDDADSLEPVLKRARNLFEGSWVPPSFNGDWSNTEKLFDSSAHSLASFTNNSQLNEESDWQSTIDWSQEEVNRLQSLVEQFPDEWEHIASLLQKDQMEVMRKWDSIRSNNIKRGQFAPEEDEYIVMRWLQWKAAKQQNGIWVTLEKEMKRRDKRIAERWRSILLPRIEKQVHMLQNKGIIPKLSTYDGSNLVENVEIIQSLLAAYDSGAANIPSGKGAIPTGESIGITTHASGIDIDSRSRSKDKNKGNIMKQPLIINNSREQHYSTMTSQFVPNVAISPQRARPLFTIKWTSEMDMRLAEGIRLYVNDWTKIAELVGMGTNNEKCRKRWYRLQRKGGTEDD